MCIVCRLMGKEPPDPRDGRLPAILDAVRRDRNMPVTLRCHADSAYRFQNPGLSENTPEGDLFNEKRDLDVLQRLGLVPGSTRPALELFERLLKNIETPQGICAYAKKTSKAWQGCADAESGNYQRGHAKGLDALFPPRDKAEMARCKRETADRMYQAHMLLIRPHHLMCMACFCGGKIDLKPIAADNLFEAVDVMRRNPDVPVKLVRGCCMICTPCSRYDPQSGLCRGGLGMNLRDQKKDLEVLQRLGLEYGDVLPARDLYALLFERIHSTRQVCGYGDGVVRAAEWSICGGAPGENESYVKSREINMGFD